MMDEVIEFIKRRFPYDNNWLDGNCYYFALILHKRFLHSKIIYNPIDGHFVVQYKNTLYDWHGVYVPSNYGSLIDWENYDKIDIDHYERIVRDVIK